MSREAIHIVFAEKDNLFRLMEMALRRAPMPEGEKTLHYFFGEDIAAPLHALTGMADRLGLPDAIEVTVCGDEAALDRSLGTADIILLQTVMLDAGRIQACAGKTRLVQQFGRLTGNVDVKAAMRLGVPIANLTRNFCTVAARKRRRRLARIERGILMKAMISALAPGVSESAFGRMWGKLGTLLDAVIPLAPFVVIVVAMGVVYFGFVH